MRTQSSMSKTPDAKTLTRRDALDETHPYPGDDPVFELIVKKLKEDANYNLSPQRPRLTLEDVSKAVSD
ncbi:unnamed protein product [Allacma fusca]|uniref:Uncharacterized protein n=1 Tax=Allacma fusca TaxID=39272 RepID=A0A8J2JBH6_9HEXA|nr:unnamed protein product [Allacma fusca]